MGRRNVVVTVLALTTCVTFIIFVKNISNSETTSLEQSITSTKSFVQHYHKAGRRQFKQRQKAKHDGFRRIHDEKSKAIYKSLADETDQQHFVTLQKRLAHVTEQCSLMGESRKKRDVAVYPPDSLIVNEEHRIIYCNVPKVGCTSWKSVFLKMGGFDEYNISALDHLGPNAKGRIYLDYLHKYSNISKRRFILQNYTKFVFVRHPFTRILSAFRNKLAPNISFFFRYQDDKARWVSNYGKQIIEKYRGKAEAERVSSDWNREYDLKFSEFIRFLVDPNTDSFNKHWSDIFSMCLPCDIDYDVIGKYETLHEDAEYILKLAKAGPGITFPTPVPGSMTNSSDPKMVDKFYKDVPKLYMMQLAKLYEKDFTLFDYDPDPFLHL